MALSDGKRAKILAAATKVFAEKGYQYAGITDIAREAGISTGLAYSYFTNKLDILLSIILSYLQAINERNRTCIDGPDEPLEKLYGVLHNFEALLIQDEIALHSIKVLNEALPHIVMIKDQRLQQKRQAIIQENKQLITSIDSIIADGQARGVFDTHLKPAALRQVLCGAIERVIYGLFFTTYSGEDIGYNTDDAHHAIVRLIDTFIRTPGT